MMTNKKHPLASPEQIMSEHDLDIDQVGIICDMVDRRSISNASFDRSERVKARQLITLGFCITENYANGMFFLPTDNGHAFVRLYNRSSEVFYERERQLAASRN